VGRSEGKKERSCSVRGGNCSSRIKLKSTKEGRISLNFLLRQKEDEVKRKGRLILTEKQPLVNSKL
jgi:hypothetical protein